MSANLFEELKRRKVFNAGACTPVANAPPARRQRLTHDAAAGG